MLRLARPVFLLLLTACATSSAPGVSPTDVPGIEGRDCRYLPLRLDEEGGGWWRGLGDTVSEPVTLSIRYGPADSIAWVRPLGIPTAAGERWAERVAEEAERAESPRADMRLRLRPGHPPRPLPPVACEPQLPRGEQFLRGSPPPGVLARAPRSTSPIHFKLTVSVGPDGEPRHARVTGGGAGMAGVESFLVDSAMSHRYLPALHDGFPVPGEFSYQMRIRTEVR